MTRVCTREGCGVVARARGLCNNHYAQWHRALPAKLGGVPSSQKEIRAVMPGTVHQLAQQTGLKYETVRKAVTKMHKDGLVHIEDFEPPTAGQGRPHAFIYVDGPGEDAKLTKKQRHESHLAARRAWYAAKKSRARQADPLVVALFGRRVNTTSVQREYERDLKAA